MRTLDDDGLTALERLLAERGADVIEAPELRRAAVLIPLVQVEEEWSIVFIRRAESMRVHKGQIAFPGGGVDEGESLETAALRETEEEVGVARSAVRLIGRLDDVVTRTGFLVAPFVGVIRERPSRYVSHPDEVTEVFEVPLSVLFSSRNPEVRYLPYRGEQFPSYFYHHEGREIWGLTGRMLKAFLDVVRIAV